MKTEKYSVTGMTCAACQANVTRCVQKLDGVDSVDVSLLANRMTVTYDETKLNAGTIISAVQAIGYGASASGRTESKGGGFREGVAGPAEPRGRKQKGDEAPSDCFCRPC